ncbi:MAG TPA: GDSL-type esterase/lipase family protein [Phycisphaerales bacterium]|nr:GDSL-type esterase/lipase family protein [Phycisphaerales bacterium]
MPGLLSTSVLWVILAAGAGEPPSWMDVPRVVASNPEHFRTLLCGGHASMLRIALIGDSQETSPGGAGSSYVPNLNERFFRRHGFVGETVVMSNRGVGGGSPPADWLWRGAIASPSGPLSGIPESARLPNITPRQHWAKSQSGQAYGMIAMLLFDGSLTADPLLPVEPYFDWAGADVRAEILLATKPVSGGVSWKAMPQPASVISYFVPSTGSGELHPDLASAGPIELRSAWTPPLNFDGKPYMQVELWGTSTEATTEIIGLRYVDCGNHRGVVVQSLGSTGARVRDLVAQHGDSGWMFAGLGYHLAVLHFGVNDAALLIAPHEWKRDLVDAIAWIRASTNDPTFPIVIAGDVHRNQYTPAQQAAFDAQPGVAAEVAAEGANLAAINLRRITFEDLGWGPGNTPYLADFVHLNVAGQRTLAGVLSATLHSIGRTACDFNDDGVIDGGDLGLLLATWGPATHQSCLIGSDLDGNGVIDGADLGILLSAWTSAAGDPVAKDQR